MDAVPERLASFYLGQEYDLAEGEPWTSRCTMTPAI